MTAVPNFGSMTLTLHGKRYLYDPKKIKLWQAIEISDKLGFTFVEFENACTRSEPKALAALYWVIVGQGGEQPALEDVLADRDLDLGEFFLAYQAAFMDWAAAAQRKTEAEAARLAPKAGGGSPAKARPAAKAAGTRKATPSSAG